MAHANDSWLDRLDIPDIPDFASPTFNPYVYDGADEWFNTHRETYTRSQMAMVSSQVVYQVDVAHSEISIHKHELPPRSHSSRSHQENTRPTGATLAAPKRNVRVPFTTAKPNRVLPNAQTKNTACHTVAKIPLAVPKPAAHVVPVPRTEGVKTAVKVRPLPTEESKTAAKVRPLPTAAALKRFPIPVRINFPANNKPFTEHRVPHVNKLETENIRHGASFHRATATIAAANHPRPTSNISLLRRRSDEMDGGPKRRSVVAARAGEYFAHILRAYPTETPKGRTNPGWK